MKTLPEPKARPKRTARRTVKQILKTAYQRHVRDRDTLRAVRRCLG